MTVLTPGAAEPGTRTLRPALTELRLTACASHIGVTLPVEPLTILTGRSGSGRSSALRAYRALARLAGGASLARAFPDPAGWVPEHLGPDASGRRGFRVGCTVDGPAGPVRLDLAVQVEPELRVAGERLTGADGTELFVTALRDPTRSTVQAAWYTAGAAVVTRAPFPDDRLGTAVVPLRVAGRTPGQRRVLAAAEQVVVALRSVFVCDPDPERMRATGPPPAGTERDTGRLLPDCGNLAAVLRRTRTECAQRHARLVAAVRAGCPGPVVDLRTEGPPDGTQRAVLDRGDGRLTPVQRLGDGELRYLALALVLLTGPGVLDVDPATEIPSAYQCLTVLADDLDRSLDDRQVRELAALAAAMCERGHVRLVGSARGAAQLRAGVPGDPLTVVDLDR
ncbi:AAA family ATPase [Streptomyces sp. NPDC059578]|uniref:AAA family ATPase n=1 Tax=Streptomyces sp. NPDC059578 TaxID=3346874 RepID=UPI00368CBAC3